MNIFDAQSNGNPVAEYKRKSVIFYTSALVFQLQL